MLPEILFILCSVVFFADVSLADNLLKETSVSPSQAPLVAPATPDLPLPANLPLFHRSRRKHLLPHGAPAHPPFFGPLVTSSQPPTSSSLSKPLMKRNALEPPSAGLANISPAQFSTGTIPSGLAEPPLSPDSSGKMYSKQLSHFWSVCFCFSERHGDPLAFCFNIKYMLTKNACKLFIHMGVLVLFCQIVAHLTQC